MRELETVASELRAELKEIRAERTAPARLRGRGLAGRERACEHRPRSVPDWVAAVPPPFARRPALPRLVVEGLFLLLVAVLAGLADLLPAWIVLVMGVAWALVALTEWAAAAKRSRWRLDEIAPPADAASKPAADTTGPWDMPVVEATVVERGPGPGVEDDHRQAARPGGGQSPSPTGRARAGAEAPPRLLRRRKPAETSAADPSAIPGRRSLAAAVAAALPDHRVRRLRRLGVVPGTASGIGADRVLRPHGGGLRDRAEASDRARVRPGRSSLCDAGDR